MISEAKTISYIQVSSELEALLLEAKLIRKYMPHYNIAAKDDKHPLYIAITKEDFPRVIAVRKLIANNYQLLASYGPFPSSTNVKLVLKLIRKIFPYSDHKITKRACLYSHIGLCNPCPSEVVRIANDEVRSKNIKKYRQNINKIKQILGGNIDKLNKSIEKDMLRASKLENFEEAAQFRNQIAQLEYITKPQMPTDFYMENPNLYEDQRKKELDSLKTLLENCKLKNVHAIAIENCTRIECFDIAHLAGTNPTASMVTFVDGEADKKFYRHFKIKKAKGGDDYASMAEVAKRRATHFIDWGKPDLIIVDGGEGQVEAFTSALNSKTESKITVVGIAKHPDRLIILPDTSDTSDIPEKPEKSEEVRKIILTGPALNLVSRMRDEAHRFARRLHHKLVSRAITNPGVSI